MVHFSKLMKISKKIEIFKKIEILLSTVVKFEISELSGSTANVSCKYQ